MKKYDIVLIHFQDHSANLEGKAKPFVFTALGIVLEETPLGYLLGHWVRTKQEKDGLGEVTTYVAKVKGLKLRKLGKILLPE